MPCGSSLNADTRDDGRHKTAPPQSTRKFKSPLVFYPQLRSPHIQWRAAVPPRFWVDHSNLPTGALGFPKWVCEINPRELGNVPTGRQPWRRPELLARCQRTAFKTDRLQRTKQLAEKVEPGVSPTPFHPRRSQHNHIMSPHSARLFFNCSLCHHSSLLPDHCHGNLARLCASCFCVVRESTNWTRSGRNLTGWWGKLNVRDVNHGV